MLILKIKRIRRDFIFIKKNIFYSEKIPLLSLVSEMYDDTPNRHCEPWPPVRR